MTNAETVAQLCDVGVSCVANELAAEYTFVQLCRHDQRTDSAVGDLEWSPLVQAISIRMSDGQKPLIRLLDEVNGHRCAAVAVSLQCDGVNSGTIVSVVPCENLAAARDVLNRLTEMSRLLSLAHSGLNDRLQRQTEAPARLTTLSKSLNYDSVGEFCYAIANGLRVESDADLVAVGLVDAHTVQLTCVSGLDEVDVDSPGSQLIRQSMEEATDARRAICVQWPTDDNADLDTDGHPLTSRWQQQVGNASVASVPLISSAGVCVAVVSVQGRHGRTITSQQMQTIRDLTLPLVSAMELMKSGRRGLLRHSMDSAAELAGMVCGPLKVYTALALVSVAMVATWMIFGTTDYIVRTPCTIVATRTRQLSAPWDGPLAQVLVRSGQIVEQGQLLARMDTQFLLSEQERAAAELRAAQIAVVIAAREAVPALIGRAVSRRDVAEAELMRIDHQLAVAEIRAPFHGQIISEDLTGRTGSTVPVGESLFEIVPNGELAVELELPESVLAYVSTGQIGSFSANARPGVAEQCRLERIEPSAKVGAAGNVVSGHAVIVNQPDWLRPGMQGVVQINTGERPVWWAWLHKAIDLVNYEVWSIAGSGAAIPATEQSELKDRLANVHTGMQR